MFSKFILFDPELESQIGHHFDLSIRLLESLKNDGYTVSILTSKKIDSDSKTKLEKFASVFPFFTTNHYQYPNKSKFPIIGELYKFIKNSKNLSKMLKNVPEGDVWIWHTFFPTELYACGLADIKKPIAACLHNEPDTPNWCNKLMWKLAFNKAANVNLRMNVGGFDKKYLNNYLPLIPNKNINIFPFPFDGRLLDRQKKQLKKIGFFGHQRKEKGSLIIKIVEKLILDGYEIVIHDTAEQIKFTHKNVKNIGYVEDLSSEIINCDLVIMPYDSNSYKSVCSGILSYVISCGIPVVVPLNSSLSYWMNKIGSGVCFEEYTSESVVKAVNNIKNNYYKISLDAYNLSKKWKKTYGIKKFSDELISEKNFFYSKY